MKESWNKLMKKPCKVHFTKTTHKPYVMIRKKVEELNVFINRYSYAKDKIHK